MGPELGTAFDVLRYDVVLAFASWALYKQLYTDPERVRVLHQAAPYFSNLLGFTHRLDVVLQLARLVDKPDTGGRDNLTLQRLPLLVTEPGLRSRVTSVVKSACIACQGPIDWRNRRLAHRDLPLALAAADEPLPEISGDDIDSALRSFADVLNLIEAHFDNGVTTAYEFMNQGREADGLFYLLERGLEADRKDVEEL